MFPSSYDFHEYYLTQAAQSAARAVTRRLQSWWPHTALSQKTLCGLGYALPYLAAYEETSMRRMAFLPAPFGPIGWPVETKNQTAVVNRTALPLPDESIDRLLLVHELEFAEDPAGVLLEAWRVLKPDGKLILVTPNRHGLWARAEHTPFGFGRPYTLKQAHRLLTDARFTLDRHCGVLLFPNLHASAFGRVVAHLAEPLAAYIPALSGLVVVEASKRLYTPVFLKHKTPAWQGIKVAEPVGS